MTVFKLDDFFGHFRTPIEYNMFVAAFEKACKQNFTPLISGGEVVGCLMNTGYTRKILTAHLVDRALADPDLLKKVLDGG